MKEALKKEITKIVTSSDYRKGEDYYVHYINSLGHRITDNYIAFPFQVESETKYLFYDTIIIKHNSGNITGTCTCEKYQSSRSCKHLAACLYNYYEEIKGFDPIKLSRQKSLDILNELLPEDNSKTVKKELKLEVNFRTIYDQINIVLKIGETKTYVVKNKLGDFFRSYYEQKGKVEFGKGFTYQPNKYYFNKEDAAIIDYLFEYFKELTNPYYANANNLVLNIRKLKGFLLLLKNKDFTIEDIGNFQGIYDENPFEPTISKIDKEYCLDLKINQNNFYPFTKDFEFIIYQEKCYHVSSKYQKLLSKMLENGIDKLIFDEKNLPIFSRSILPIIKEEVVIDSTATSTITIVKKPDIQLYFDLHYNSIYCNFKLTYGTIQIDYFDNNNSILRDIEVENEVLNDLFQTGFLIEKQKIKINDLDLIGDFFEFRLEELAAKYEVFTSEKIKDTKVYKNSKISSTFSLGQDNIMNFNFELEGVSNKELDSLLSSLKQKKKYFKLKNGNLINLENNQQLKQFENLVDELNLTSSNLANGEVIIPKYRAIYLDSLKKDKYDIIETDNLFEQFIQNFNNYQNQELKLSNSDKKILRDYQITGVKWLYNIYKCDFGGILADEMGLGKSIQVIYFIKKLLEEDSTSKFLIVSPTSLVYNWSNEFNKFASDIKYEIFSDNKNKRHELLDSTSANVYITSYGLLREDLEYYQKLNFKVCIIDEAQNIKNPIAGITKAVKNINAQTRIALTGTPIENSVVELWSIYDFVMPGFLSTQTEFQSKYRIKEFNDTTETLLNNLNKQIAPFILRRKKIDVLKDLPDKIENNIYIDLSSNQKKLYAAEVKRVREEMDRLIQSEGFTKARFLILQLLTKLRQLCIDPRIIFDDYHDESTKIETLIKVVQELKDNGHKILLFTSFKTALELVREEFNKNKISSYTIDGSVSSKKRMELVTTFNNDDTDVFLIMLKSGGTGLNLTSADVVIHLDLWWNPQAENQATDRAHRIGQKHTVEVVKLVAKDTIEEKILELQEKKKQLSDKIIEGKDRDKNMITDLTEDDLRNLLSYEQKN